MGVDLGPITPRQRLPLAGLRGRTLAVDAAIQLYQFLSILRLKDGSPLQDREGHVTSHLSGLLFRTVGLIAEHGVRFVFVFDGAPPELKRREIERRREVKRKADVDYQAALAAGDTAKAWSKLVQTTRLTSEMIADARRLLDLLGIPWVEAPEEAEAQAAYMAIQGDCWAAESKDFDTLLFGAPRMARFVGIAGREFLPSQGAFRKVEPEVIDLAVMLKELSLSRKQLVDAAILIGTDFNDGVKGIGPKTAVKLLRQHGSLEGLPAETRSKLPGNLEEIRGYFLSPPTTNDYEVLPQRPDLEGARRFLVEERDFAAKRVDEVLERYRRSLSPLRRLDEFR